MARGGTGTGHGQLTADSMAMDVAAMEPGELHAKMTALAAISDRFLDPDLPAPGVRDAAAEASAAKIAALDPSVLAEAFAGGVVLDLDDTLTTNVPLFHHARWVMTPIYAEASGRDDLLELMHEREAVCTRLLPTLGYTPLRWRTACETYLDEIAPDAPDELRERVMVGAEVALGVGEFYGGVEQTLQALHDAGVPMVLLTKGEVAKQTEKIKAHRLERFFTPEQIVIVDHKDAALLREVVAAAGMQDPVIIGDSAASDVAPAREAGYRSVHVDRGAGVTWAAEHHDAGADAAKSASMPEAIEHLLD
jgi:putative hydrolase of the HAD superfamily